VTPPADNTDDLRLTVEIAADPASVWSAIANGERRRIWWPDLELEARAGGTLLERWRDAGGREQWTRGAVRDIEEGRRLRCSWRDDGWPADTELEIRLRREGARRTQVLLRHSGWRRLPDGAALRAAHREGWSMHLADLKAFVER
jgi:uncharacterized protein YndB with AHSA1/START domain